eukprot:1657128-Prymnesium_polylepis.1
MRTAQPLRLAPRQLHLSPRSAPRGKRQRVGRVRICLRRGQRRLARAPRRLLRVHPRHERRVDGPLGVGLAPRALDPPPRLRRLVAPLLPRLGAQSLARKPRRGFLLLPRALQEAPPLLRPEHEALLVLRLARCSVRPLRPQRKVVGLQRVPPRLRLGDAALQRRRVGLEQRAPARARLPARLGASLSARAALAGLLAAALCADEQLVAPASAAV